MALQSFDRNYGMSAHGVENFMGNNGFVTVVIKLPTDVEVGATVVAQDGTDVAQSALSAAQRNQFKIVQALSQRAVVIAVSTLAQAADPTVGGFETVGGNVLAFGKAGVLAAGSFAVTFIVERADVMSKQLSKPGSTYALSVDPCADIAAIIAGAGFLEKKDGSKAPAVAGCAIKVYDALPAILA